MKKLIVIPALLAKAHIDSYTRKDGTVVAAHDDKRTPRQMLAYHEARSDYHSEKYNRIQSSTSRREIHEDASRAHLNAAEKWEDVVGTHPNDKKYKQYLNAAKYASKETEPHEKAYEGWRTKMTEKHKDDPAKLHKLLKSHIDSYTRKDGTVVAAHDDKRVAAKPKDAHPDFGPHKVGDTVSYKGERGSTRTGKVKGSRDGKVVVEHSAGYTELKHHSELSAAGGSSPASAGSNAAPAKKPAVTVRTRNESHGFHGEAYSHHLRQKHGPDNYISNATEQDHVAARAHAEKLFSNTANKLVQAGHFEKPEDARDYLDSKSGRHFHNEAPDGDINKVSWLAKDVKNYKNS